METQKDDKILKKMVKMLQQEGVGSRTVIEWVETERRKNALEYTGLEDCLNMSNQVLAVPYWSVLYPELLKQLKDKPAMLFCKGDVMLLQKDCFAVVGTRKMSGYGRRAVRKLFERFQNADRVLVSGLAYGVDSEAHTIALRSGIPTVAVVAGGMDRGYPPGNEALFQEIAKYGVVVSEFPEGRAVFKGMFPMRNRIMAGMSSHCLVIEAPVKSGAMITARYAADYGREVGAVPGSIFDVNQAGCLKIISEGATPICSREEMYIFLGIDYLEGMERLLENKIVQYPWLQDLFNVRKYPGGFNVGDCSRQSGFSVKKCVQILTSLEMDGILRQNRYGSYIRCE